MLTGKVSRVLATRDPTEQARPLTVAEVLRLEVMLDTVRNKYDKYFIECILYAYLLSLKMERHGQHPSLLLRRDRHQ